MNSRLIEQSAVMKGKPAHIDWANSGWRHSPVRLEFELIERHLASRVLAQLAEADVDARWGTQTIIHEISCPCRVSAGAAAFALSGPGTRE
jgi:hypothetical protein